MDRASERLREKILGRGRTMADVAQRIGVSDRTLRDYVKSPEVMVGAMRRLTEELDLTPADVWCIVTGQEISLLDLLRKIKV